MEVRLLSRVCFKDLKHQVGEGGDESGGISDGGHHLKLFDAGFVGLLAGFDVDFVEGFDVLGDEGDGNDEEIFFAGAGEAVDGFDQRGRQPFAAADFALVAEEVRDFSSLPAA